MRPSGSTRDDAACTLLRSSHNCVSYIFFSSAFEAQHASLHPVSRRLGRKRHQQFHFLWIHHGQNFSVHRNSDSSFLFFCQADMITPIHNWSVDTELIDRVNEMSETSVFTNSQLKWMVHLPFLCFKIPQLKALVLLKRGWPVSLNRCAILLAVQFHCPCYHGNNFFSTSLPTLDPRMSLREFHCVTLDFFGIRNTILIIIFPYNVIEHWHEDDLPSRSGSREEEIVTNTLGNFSTRIQAVLRRVPLSLGTSEEHFLRSSTWLLHLSIASEISFTCPTPRTESA